MDDRVIAMLSRYKFRTAEEKRRALREIVQEIALLALWRAKFFEKAAFYGGTALRIHYGLDRFSEDLDFSLLHSDPHFLWRPFQHALESELASFGLSARFSEKDKSHPSAIQSAFLKANTFEQLLRLKLIDGEESQHRAQEIVRIKLEVDTDPPLCFSTEMHYLLLPIPFAVKVFSKGDLFAGKMHALLCRGWKNRVKGRDWYDFVWFISREIKLHLLHLEVRMRQTGHWSAAQPLDKEMVKILLQRKIEAVDLNGLKADVLPFLKDPSILDMWTKDFFYAMVQRIAFSD